MKNSTFDHQSSEALKNTLLQSDANLNNPHQKYVSLEISKSVHSRLFAALAASQKENALYNLDNFLHQMLDRWEQESFEQTPQTFEEKPSHWKNLLQKK